jgi:hypothetical protein
MSLNRSELFGAAGNFAEQSEYEEGGAGKAAAYREALEVLGEHVRVLELLFEQLERLLAEDHPEGRRDGEFPVAAVVRWRLDAWIEVREEVERPELPLCPVGQL